MAESWYHNGRYELQIAFEELVRSGLFFEIYPGTFKFSVYYCSYDINQLAIIEEDQTYFNDGVKIWKYLNTLFIDNMGVKWLKFGFCLGQGSPSGSAQDGICMGKECISFTYGNKIKCN